MRVLGTKDPDIHLEELLDNLRADDLTAKLEFADGDTPEKWTILQVSAKNGDTLAQIERNPVVDGELGKEELDEFREEVEDCKPQSAAKWLIRFFDRVKVIYAFQMLHCSLDNGNYEIVNSVRTKIWRRIGGILQADNEGFSNEDGYHILWQFADNVKGEWSMAVKNFFGSWTKFKMDLGDQQQREDFWKGNVPKRAYKL